MNPGKLAGAANSERSPHRLAASRCDDAERPVPFLIDPTHRPGHCLAKAALRYTFPVSIIVRLSFLIRRMRFIFVGIR